MIPYILYASIILSACLLFYKLLLQKETFYSLNRFILLGCMAVAFLLPLLQIPAQFSLRKQQTIENTKPQNKITTKQETTLTSQNQNETATPAAAVETVTFNKETIKKWLVYLYWFGVLIFAGNFLMQAIILFYRAYTNPAIKDGKYRIVEITGDKAPCSFANNIFINPEKYDWETYNQVLLHEKIHIQERHTLDLLLVEIMLIFQWFNPFAWQWRKELESNLEYFTDDCMLRQEEVKKENYQMSLLKVAAPHFPLSLTTNYNQSLLKKRLIMMNSKKSNMNTTWKYFFLLPMMVIFACLFNEPIMKGQNINTHSNNDEKMSNKGIWFATIKGEKVQMQFRDDEDENSNNSSNSFMLSELGTLPTEKDGKFSVVREAGTMEFIGKFDGNKGMGNYNFIPNTNYKTALEKEGVNIKSDIIIYFLLDIKASYIAMLKKNGFNDLDKDNIIPLAALKIDEAYIKSIKEAGFADINLDDMVPLKSLNVDKAYIEELRSAGVKNLTPDKVISCKAQGLDGKSIKDFNIGKDNKSKKNHIDINDDLKINTETNNTINTTTNKSKAEIESDGENDLDDLIAFKSMNITQEYVNSIKGAGYPSISNSDIIAMKSLGVTAEYIKGLLASGFKNISADDIVAMKSLGVTEEYAASFKTAGYNKLKADDLVALKSQNVTPALIKEYADLGFADVDIDDIIAAKATGTTPSFIKLMKEKGHVFKSINKYVAFKSVMGQ
jgi:beta-lactamase regulating signal transducer with metallopeptidase domain